MRAYSLIATMVVLGLSMPLVSSAQEGTFFAETVEVELVLVDVLVTDKKGELVADLNRDDFQLFEDGNAVEIEQFSIVSGSGKATPAVAGSSGSSEVGNIEIPPARLVIFVDELNLGPGRRKRLFDQLMDALNSTLRPQDLVMVVSYTGVVKTRLPFTTDRKALRRTLMDASDLQARAVVASLGADRILQLIENRHSDNTQQGGFTSGDPCVDLGYIARTYAEQTHSRVLGTASEMSLFVKSLAGYPGRKTLLYVSDGIPLIAGLEVYSYAIELCDGSGGNKGVPNSIDTSQLGSGKYTRWDPTTAWAELTQFNSTDDWTQLAADANTYQVSIYAVQALGITGHQRGQVDRAITSQDTAMQAYRNSQDPLFMMADETGGTAILDTNQFRPEFAEMVEDTRHGYQLAFTPPGPGDSKQHEIRVKVDRPHVEVRYRKSYRRKTNDERIADGILTSLFHNKQENPFKVRLEMARSEAVTKNVTNVTMRLHIPLSSLILIPEGDIQKGIFTVFVGVMDGHGSIMPVRQKTMPFRIAAADLGQESGREYVYEVEIPVRGQESLVAVAVRDELGGSASFLTKRVQVGEG